MSSRPDPTQDVISPKAYQLILGLDHLRSQLLPEGPFGSPYEILDYQATLILTDPRGRRAIFHRTQQIRFLQDGVRAILDHLWGDGVQLVGYRNTAGLIGESFKDEGRRHLMIGLARPARRGDVLTFEVERAAMAGFTDDDEWLETTIDHPIHQLGQWIVFPKERPCEEAALVVGDESVPLRLGATGDGRTMLHVQIERPRADTPYRIRWRW